MQQQGPGLRADEGQLPVLRQGYQGRQGALVGVGPGELAAVGGGGVGREGDPCALAVFKEEQHMPAVIPRQHQVDDLLLLVHPQLGGQIVPQQRRLAVGKIGGPDLIHLLMVGEEHQLGVVGGLHLAEKPVTLLELLLAAHAQRLGGDLLKISLPGQKQRHGIVRRLLRLLLILRLMAENDLRFPGLGVLFPHLLQLSHDDLADAGGLLQGILQVLNFLLQGGGLLDPLEDVFFIDVAQLDLRHILRLNLVDAEADHQVGHYLRLLLGLADDLNGLVNVQQNALEALQKVQLLLLFVQHEVHPPPHAFRAPGQPLLQQRLHPQHPGHSGDEDVKVAAHRVLQGGQAEELLHELVRVYAPL